MKERQANEHTFEIMILIKIYVISLTLLDFYLINACNEIRLKSFYYQKSNNNDKTKINKVINYLTVR